MEKAIFFSASTLVQYPAKSKRQERKEKYVEKLLQGFKYTGNQMVFRQNLIAQVQEFVSNKLSDPEIIDISGYKLYNETCKVLEDLKKSGYRIYLTSDTSFELRLHKIINSLNLAFYIDGVVSYEKISVKKSEPNYWNAVFTYLNLEKSSEIIIVSSRVDKELTSAYHKGLKHIWVNLSLENIESNKKAIQNLGKYPRTVMSIFYILNAIEYYEPKGINVGYMIPTIKKKQLLAHKYVFMSNNNFWYNSLYPYSDLGLQGDFQVVINKAVDLLSMPGDENLQAFEDCKEFFRRNPQIIPIDTLEKCQELLTRVQFFEGLNKRLNIIVDGITIRLPWQKIYQARTKAHIENAKFPVLVKANTASITQMSHIMSLVFTDQGLEKASSLYSEKNEDFIIQEFINHDMTVYKIYVIGSNIYCKPRESCSNLDGGIMDLVTFHSAEPWPKELLSGQRVVKELNMQAIIKVAELIEEELGLTILGFDVLVQSETGDYVVVDVNVFPGFKEFNEIGSYLEALVMKKLNKS